MADRKLPTPERLRKLILYDHVTGKLFWLPRCAGDFEESCVPREARAKEFNEKYVGAEALAHKNNEGYLSGFVEMRPLKAHRVAWAIYYGEWPDGAIDHINGERSDNRIANLRCVSVRENCMNMARVKANSSGLMGVGFCKKSRKWRARIFENGRQISLGHFISKEEAFEARLKAERELGYHPNHNRPPS